MGMMWALLSRRRGQRDLANVIDPVGMQGEDARSADTQIQTTWRSRSRSSRRSKAKGTALTRIHRRPSTKDKLQGSDYSYAGGKFRTAGEMLRSTSTTTLSGISSIVTSCAANDIEIEDPIIAAALKEVALAELAAEQAEKAAAEANRRATLARARANSVRMRSRGSASVCSGGGSVSPVQAVAKVVAIAESADSTEVPQRTSIEEGPERSVACDGLINSLPSEAFSGPEENERYCPVATDELSKGVPNLSVEGEPVAEADVGAEAEAKDESEAATSSTPPRAPACSGASEGSEGTASGSRYLAASVEKRLEALQSGLRVDEGARKLSFSRVSSGDAEAAQPPSPSPQPSPSPSPDTHSSIMRDFEDLLLIDELVTDAFSIFDTEQGGSIAIYSLAELVQDRVYTTTKGNKLLRVSRREILLADRISLRINIDEDEIVASDQPLTPRADANAPRVEPSTSPADHAANAMANAANVAAAVRVQCASRGMLVRLRAMEARAECDRNEWIAYFVGQGLFDDARALGWEGQIEGRAAAETDGCVIC